MMMDDLKYVRSSRNTYFKTMRIVKKLISHIILIIASLFAVFPIYYVVITSLSNVGSLVSVSVSGLLPSLNALTLSNYYSILFREPFLLWLKNTLIFSGTSTVIGVALAIISGLGFSRTNMPGKKALLYMLLILSMFPFTIMVIPFYFMFAKLDLLDTYLGLIIPYSAGAVIFVSWLMKNYLDAIPRDYEEAAQLDGLSKTGALFRILLPMAKPVIAFAIVLAFMGPYTDYALSGQFITSPGLYTMAIGMYYVSQNTITVNYSVFAAFAILMGLPIFILFFVFQKYLVSGFTLSMYK